MVARAGARGGSGDASCVYGGAGGGVGACGRGDAAVSISLYGGAAEGSGQAGGADGDSCGGGARGASIPDSRSGSRFAVAGGRKVDGRANDFAGGGRRFDPGSARAGVFWISAASA